MEALLAAAAAWTEASGLGAWARGSADVYPIANTFHLLGLVMLVGGIGIVDLRHLGAFRALPAEALDRALTPVALVGLAVLVPSGTVLFAADARALVSSDTFRLKLVLIGAALVNAILFRLVRRGRTGPPGVSRAFAAVSLALWLSVGTAGRMIAYT